MFAKAVAGVSVCTDLLVGKMDEANAIGCTIRSEVTTSNVEMAPSRSWMVLTKPLEFANHKSISCAWVKGLPSRVPESDKEVSTCMVSSKVPAGTETLSIPTNVLSA